LTDVGTWTNWLTFEPDPDYSPDAGTGLLSPISYALQRGILLRREHPTYWAPVAAARRGFKMVLFTASRGNTFVGGTCALPLPSAILVWRWIMVTLKSGLWTSLKVIKTGTIRKLGCGFLSAFHSKYGSIFLDKAIYWSKIVIFSYPLAFDAPVRGRGVPVGVLPSVWYGKTRMVWVPDGEKSDETFSRFDRIPTCDRQTDGRTDILSRHSPRYRICVTR